jgi:desulfoferrodoxin-like iron-binding protein
MKKLILAGIFVAGAAIGLALAVSGPAAQQAEPYTMTSFGPWNAAVAKTHVPMVKFEKTNMGFKVTVQVDNHPMDPQKPHWIEWIRIDDAKGNRLAEKAFKPTDPSPAVAEFELPAIYDSLKVLEHCNIHGTWLNEAAVGLK